MSPVVLYRPQSRGAGWIAHDDLSSTSAASTRHSRASREAVEEEGHHGSVNGADIWRSWGALARTLRARIADGVDRACVRSPGGASTPDSGGGVLSERLLSHSARCRAGARSADLKAKQDLANAGLLLGLIVLLTPQFGLAGAAGAKLIVSCAELAGLFLLAARVAPQALQAVPLLHVLRPGVAVSVAFVLPDSPQLPYRFQRFAEALP